MKEYFKYIWRVITTPSCWIRNHPTSKSWDYTINKLLDKYQPSISETPDYTVMISSTEVWIKNKFYCYGHEFDFMWPVQYDRNCKLPSRKTCFRLHDAIKKAGLQ